MTLPFADFLRTPDGFRFKDRVREALRRNLENLAETLFGQPKPSRRRKEMRFAGGLIIELAGNKRGRWYSHTAGKGGYEPQLIAFGRGCDQTAAWQWAGHFSGIEPEQKRMTEAEHREWLERQKREREERRRRQAAAEERERDTKIGAALAIWAACIAIAGTLGERYLVEIRAIPVPAAGWPHDAVRWHEGERAVVFAATNEDGEVTAVHQIYLTPSGQNRVVVKDKKVRKLKLTRGVLDGAVVRLPSLGHGLRAPLQHAEGCETGLSGWRATGYATQIWLGGLPRAKLPHGRINILLRDDDAEGSPAARHLEKALAAWRADGIAVVCATPWPEPRGDKSDLNDVLREAGLDAVCRQIRLAELEAHGLQPAPPPFPLPTATTAEIGSQIAKAVNNLFARRDQAPRILVRAATGTRKTETIGELLPNYILVDKANKRPHRVLDLVPAHRLGRQIAERYTTKGLDTAVFEGRGDPYREPPPGRQKYLCSNLDEVALAIEAGADVAKSVCGSSKTNEAHCPYRMNCAYFNQIDRAANADVVFIANNFAFEPVPPSIQANVGTVVIDEDFTAHGDGTVELPLSTFSDGALLDHPVLDKEGERDHAKTAELEGYFATIRCALDSASQGRPLAEAIAAEDLTKGDIKKARGLNWKRKIDPAMWPGMPVEQRRAASKAARFNPELRRIAAALHAIEEAAPTELSGTNTFSGNSAAQLPLSLEQRIEFDGPMMTVYGLREPADWLENKPILIASATARADRLQRFFPTLEDLTLPPPALPYQTVHQHLGSFGQRAMARRLSEYIADAQLLTMGKSALVITHLKFEEAFKKALPGVAVRHHGDVAGDNDYGDVEIVVQYGGPFPEPRDIARLASAEAGRIVPVAKPVKTSCVALMADGTGVQFDRLAYQDPAAQSMLEDVYDQAFVQGGLGRGRGINRTAANQLEIHISGNVPLPVPIASIDRWSKPSRLAKMMLRGHVPLGAADMRRFYPDLFRSEDVARQAKHRWGGKAEIKAELRRLADRMPWPSVAVIWQPTGQGHKTRLDIVARPRLEEVRSAAEREFGGLVGWRVEPFSRGGAPLKPTAEECDIPRKEVSFPEMSRSSRKSADPAPPLGETLQPRAPPDG